MRLVNLFQHRQNAVSRCLFSSFPRKTIKTNKSEIVVTTAGRRSGRQLRKDKRRQRKTFGRFHFEKPNFFFFSSTSLGIVFGRKSNRCGLCVIFGGFFSWFVFRDIYDIKICHQYPNPLQRLNMKVQCESHGLILEKGKVLRFSFWPFSHSKW